MTTAQIAVTLAGLAAIAWINWYFFVAGARQPAVAAVAAPGGVQRVHIVVHGGYSPAAVRVKAGVPVRLEFERTETSSCSEEVVLGDFGIRRHLPAHRTTTIEFTPDRSGRFEYTCGMGMLRGVLEVE